MAVYQDRHPRKIQEMDGSHAPSWFPTELLDLELGDITIDYVEDASCVPYVMADGAAPSWVDEHGAVAHRDEASQVDADVAFVACTCPLGDQLDHEVFQMAPVPQAQAYGVGGGTLPTGSFLEMPEQEAAGGIYLPPFLLPLILWGLQCAKKELEKAGELSHDPESPFVRRIKELFGDKFDNKPGAFGGPRKGLAFLVFRVTQMYAALRAAIHLLRDVTSLSERDTVLKKLTTEIAETWFKLRSFEATLFRRQHAARQKPVPDLPPRRDDRETETETANAIESGTEPLYDPPSVPWELPLQTDHWPWSVDY